MGAPLDSLVGMVLYDSYDSPSDPIEIVIVWGAHGVVHYVLHPTCGERVRLIPSRGQSVSGRNGGALPLSLPRSRWWVCPRWLHNQPLVVQWHWRQLRVQIYAS